jgi:hypothetical protein
MLDIKGGDSILRAVVARLGDNAIKTAAIVTLFCVGIARENAELGDGVQVADDSRVLSDGLMDAYAIQGKAIGGFALAVNRELPSIGVACHGNRSEPSSGCAVPCATRGERRDPHLRGKQIGIAAAV